MINKKKVYEERTFTLTAEQMEKFDTWRIKKNERDGQVNVGAIGGAYTFCFTPTGLGMIEEVRCSDGTKINLTDVDNW